MSIFVPLIWDNLQRDTHDWWNFPVPVGTNPCGLDVPWRWVSSFQKQPHQNHRALCKRGTCVNPSIEPHHLAVGSPHHRLRVVSFHPLFRCSIMESLPLNSTIFFTLRLVMFSKEDFRNVNFPLSKVHHTTSQSRIAPRQRSCSLDWRPSVNRGIWNRLEYGNMNIHECESSPFAMLLCPVLTS